MEMQNKDINPQRAALLNALPVPLGFGYKYMGMRRRFIFAFLVGIFTIMLGAILGLLVSGIFAFRQ